MPALGDENVGGLDVAMDDSFHMRRIESVRNLNPQLQHLLKRQRLAGNAVLQRLTVQELHHDVCLTVFFADVINRADVRVIERGSSLCLALEAFECLRIVR